MRQLSDHEHEWDALARLAADYDRWGLSREAETLRRHYREATVRELRDNALAAAAREPARKRRPAN